MERTFGARPGHLVAWAWIASILATAGSLYLSEVMNFAPCALCWYQRIAMYPLVVVLGVGIVTGDLGVWRYSVPLAGIGLAIAVYHIVIQWQPTLDAGVCAVGVPCTARYVAVWGFVSIPTMAASAFALILATMGVLRFLGERR
ncbi:MAG: disulfide bond formation protein B [Gemmatimonadetes bacterium]|nr:disulfide bond formation protein B [Gemmatimonadota bacterium]